MNAHTDEGFGVKKRESSNAKLSKSATGKIENGVEDDDQGEVMAIAGLMREKMG